MFSVFNNIRKSPDYLGFISDHLSLYPGTFSQLFLIITVAKRCLVPRGKRNLSRGIWARIRVLTDFLIWNWLHHLQFRLPVVFFPKHISQRRRVSTVPTTFAQCRPKPHLAPNLIFFFLPLLNIKKWEKNLKLSDMRRGLIVLASFFFLIIVEHCQSERPSFNFYVKNSLYLFEYSGEGQTNRRSCKINNSSGVSFSFWVRYTGRSPKLARINTLKNF